MHRRNLIKLGSTLALAVPVLSGPSGANKASVKVHFDATGTLREDGDFDWHAPETLVEKGDRAEEFTFDFVAPEPNVEKGIADEDTKEFMWNFHLAVEDGVDYVGEYWPEHMDAEKDTDSNGEEVRVWGKLIMMKDP